MSKSLRSYKNTVHMYLDGIWKNCTYPGKARTVLYKWLATQMGLSKSETHISLFNIEQCKQAIKILRPRYIQLYGKDISYKRRCVMYFNTFRFNVHPLDAKRHQDAPEQIALWKVFVSCKSSKVVNNDIIDKEVFFNELKLIIVDYNTRLDTDNPMSIYTVAKLLYDRFPEVFKIEIHTDYDEVIGYAQEINIVN